MKGRVLSLGVISIISFILTLIAVAVLGSEGTSFSANLLKNGTVAGVLTLLVIAIILDFVLFILGIVTLASKKSESARGLTIAAGVLSILIFVFNFIFGVGLVISFVLALVVAILSFVGASKIKDTQEAKTEIKDKKPAVDQKSVKAKTISAEKK